MFLPFFYLIPQKAKRKLNETEQVRTEQSKGEAKKESFNLVFNIFDD